MRLRDAFGIYHVLETQLKRTDRPLTCVELFDHPDVKKFADNGGTVVIDLPELMITIRAKQ